MGYRLFYRVLLLAYPRAFRRDHGDEAARLFDQACRESWQARGVADVLARLCRALIDVPVRGLAERASARPGGSTRHKITLLSDLLQDARYGIRSLRRSPAFTITALVTMTIGITLNTAMFTVFNAVGLRGWPVENADRLVLIRPEGSSPLALPGFSLDDLERFERSQTLAVVAGSRRAFNAAVSLEPGGRVRGGGFGHYVTRGFFEATGVRFVLGRDFRPEENRVNAHEPVVIISHNLWREVFDGSPDVIGRSVYFGKTAYAVIGVTREGWRGEQPYREDVWLPLDAMRQAWPDDPLFSSKAGRCCLNVLGLLAPGHSRAQAGEELALLARSGQGDPPRPVVVSDTSMYDRTTGSLRAGIALSLLVATGLILLLTGANIAHLQLARAIARAREIRTRMALGAGRGRVIRQLITEAVLVTVVAGVFAMVLVYAFLDTLMRISEVQMLEVWTPNLLVYAYCIAVSFAMSITFSLLPALRSTRVSLSQAAGATATTNRLRFNLVLLTAQIALSTSLLTGAALLTRAFVHATRGDAGFTIDGLTIATYRPSGPAPQTAARRIWPGESPIGKTLFYAKRPYSIVGVSRDVHFFSREAIRPTLHVAAGTAKTYPGIVIRGGGPAVADRLKSIVTSLDPQAAVTVRTLSDTIASRLGDEKAGAQAAWAGGLLALALATFGVFGVFAYVVEERRREIGIRVALGAQKRQVLTTMFRPARKAVTAGLALGLVLSLSVGPALNGLGIRLFGLSPFDPITFAAVGAILAVAALAATFIPARRALGLNPAVILKEDP